MKIATVFEADVDKKLAGRVYTGPGVSYIIDTGKSLILFDLGIDLRRTLHNLHILGYDVENIEHVVISHPHHDHLGGRWNEFFRYLDLSSFSEDVTVHAPVGIRANRRVTVYSDGVMEIDGISVIAGFRTGYRMIPFNELYCVANDLLITGCGHYGIFRVLDRMNTLGLSIRHIWGGIHFRNTFTKETVSRFREYGIEKIYISPHDTDTDNAEKYDGVEVLRVGYSLSM